MSVATGSRLGPYEILELLGAGGMGEVYRARDSRLDREVAVKVLPDRFSGRPERLQRLEREARAAGSLNHPNIVTVYDVGSHEGRPYLVSELLQGATLRELIAYEHVGLRQALDLGLQMARGLACAHEAGILHRDLKPANVFRTREGRLKLLDFGLAKLVRPQDGVSPEARTATAVTGAEGPVGTAAYMSPEQIRDEPLDGRADLFGVGAILYELLSRRRAFEGATDSDVMAAILRDDPQSLSAYGVSVPPAVETVLRRCLAKRREERFGSARELAAALETLLDVLGRGGVGAESAEERSPFPGLRSFTEQEAGFFFGREAEVEGLWRRLRQSRLLAVIGASGAGKTSFLRAGAVAARPAGWAVVVSTPSSAPMLALGQALAPELASDHEALRQLLRFDEADVAVELVARWRRRHAHALVVVDQFEELFTLNAPDAQDRFAQFLGRLLTEADAHVVLCLRDDFLMRCHEHPALQSVFDGLMPLGQPAGEALRRAVVEPAARNGFRFQDDRLVDELVAAVEGERGALPLLAFATARLWELRDREHRVLLRAAYERIGGVVGCLAQHAEATIERIGIARQDTVREIFRNLVTAAGTRAARDRDELVSIFGDRKGAERVLRELIDARLVTSYEVSGVDGQAPRQRVDISHEALLQAWPRLVRWRTQDADGAQLRDQLRRAAGLWEERGRPADLLWTGDSYREYEVWRRRHGGGLTEAERRFSAALTAQALRRRRRKRMALAAAFAVLLAVSTVTGVSWRKSEQSRRRAEAASLVALAQVEMSRYPTAAIAYVIRSLELADGFEARRLAVEALWKGPPASILRLPESRDWWTAAFSPDGRWLATAGSRDEVLVWPSSGDPPVVLRGHGLQRTSAYFSPDGSLLGTLTYPGGHPLRIWSLPWGELVRTIEFPNDTFVLQRGERLLAFTAAHDARRVRSWGFRGGEPSDIGIVPAARSTDFDVDPKGEWVAIIRGRRVFLRGLRPSDDRPERLVGEHRANVISVCFGPQQRLLSHDESGEMRLWHLGASGPRLLRALPGPAGASNQGCARFDATGSWLAARFERARAIRLFESGGPPGLEPLELRTDAVRIGGIDIGTTRSGPWLAMQQAAKVSLWPLARRYPRVFTGHADRVNVVRFASDGRWIASGSWDGTVRTWPLDEGAGPASLVSKMPGAANNLAVDLSGRRVLVAYSGSGIFLAPTNGRAGVRLGRLPHAQIGVAFDAVGRRAAFSAALARGSAIRIWDLDHAVVLKDLPLGDGSVVDLAFTPDGQLYSAGSGGVKRWNVGTGTSELTVAGGWMRMDLGADGRHLITVTQQDRQTLPSVADFHDLTARRSTRLASHGTRVISVALDPRATVVVTGSQDGIIRVGPATGEEPHLLLGHEGAVHHVAVSPDGRWIASGGQDGTVRLWPMPDRTRPPLHARDLGDLLVTLKSLTNLRVVEDALSPTGYSLQEGPFKGWDSAPAW